MPDIEVAAIIHECPGVRIFEVLCVKHRGGVRGREKSASREEKAGSQKFFQLRRYFHDQPYRVEVKEVEFLLVKTSIF